MTSSIDDDPYLMYDKNIAKEVLGESKGVGLIGKEIWWSNEEVQTTIKFKKANFKTWQHVKDEESLKNYKEVNKELKKW